MWLVCIYTLFFYSRIQAPTQNHVLLSWRSVDKTRRGMKKKKVFRERKIHNKINKKWTKKKTITEWSVPGKRNCRANCFSFCFGQNTSTPHGFDAENENTTTSLAWTVVCYIHKAFTHLLFCSLRPNINNTIITSDCCLFYEH